MHSLENFALKIRVLDFFTRGHERSILAKKNIAASFIIKGASIAIGLAIVPLTINYLEPMKYGIWITLSSILGWFSFFDIGLGQGLRNRFAESLAKGKHELAKVYVSTTYAIMGLIFSLLIIVLYMVNPFLNWNKLLNVTQDVVIKNELNFLVLIVFTFFCLRFVFQLITTILTADQRPAKASFFDLVGKIISLILIYVITQTTESSLLYLGVIMSSVPVVVLVVSSLWFFNGKYKFYKPSIKSVDFSKAKDLLNLGIKFFIIQIAVILLYQTNYIIISHLFGPEQVTPYNVAFKYFSVIMMGFIIIVTPFWSAFTEAWVNKEIAWVKNIMGKLVGIWFALVVLGVIMLLSSKFVYTAWVGDKVQIPFILSALVCAWVLLNAWNNIYSYFLNGIGKITLQMCLGISCAVINVPLAIYFGIKIGIDGIVLANLIIAAVQAIIVYIQYKKLITFKAQGVWIK